MLISSDVGWINAAHRSHDSTNSIQTQICIQKQKQHKNMHAITWKPSKPPKMSKKGEKGKSGWGNQFQKRGNVQSPSSPYPKKSMSQLKRKSAITKRNNSCTQYLYVL